MVSIIIPTYNRADIISETLDTILLQTHTNWECIIVDDGSTDNTREALQKYLDLDSRFQYHFRPMDRPKGANACRNYGYELSKGKYIKWFDSDDLMHPEFLEKQVVILERNDSLDFCASFSEMFDVNSGRRWFPTTEMTENKNALFNYIAGKLIFLTPSPLWRKSFLNRKILFDENLLNAHETDFNFKRLIEGGSFEYIKEVLFYVRRGHESIDFNSVKDPENFKSIFVYYQKVYDYLCTPSVYLTTSQRYILRKEIIRRQSSSFYTIRFLQTRKECREVFLSLIKNVKKSGFYL